MNPCIHPDGCDRPIKGHGWCRAHLDRIRKTGNPGPADVAPRSPLGRPCCLPDCDQPVTNDAGLGMCSTHYQRQRKHGSPDVVKKGGASLALESNPNWSGDAASYMAVHLRLRNQRGRAKDFSCVDCDAKAAHWSYNNTDPDERFEHGMGRYSTDLTNYEPRCVRCHKAHDNAARALLTGERP